MSLSLIHVLFARIVLCLHLIFILYVVFGGFLTRRYERSVWIHLPIVAWGTGITFVGWKCPLTPLEKWFLQKAHYPAYPGSFIEHYMIDLIYLEGLTPGVQYALGVLVIIVNVWAYAPILYQKRLD